MSVERPPSLTGRRLFLLSPLALALLAARATPAERGREPTGAPPPPPTLQPIPYLTSDSGIGGPNAFSMVDGLHLPWPSRTPWLDANGVAGGLKPFAAHAFSLHERYTFPVTALVRKFVSGQNRGFCLRPVGDFAMNFGGRLA